MATEVDGRRLRRDQNRAAVLEALVELFEEGVYEPSSAEIADRAGLSARSLFRYFDDVDDLNRAAIALQMDRARPLVEPGVGPGAPTGEKVARLVEARARMFEAIGPAARAARASAHRHAVVAEQITGARRFLRHQIRRLFVDELRDRPDAAAAADVLLSFESWELLRGDHGLSRRKAVSTLTNALTALLDPHGGPS